MTLPTIAILTKPPGRAVEHLAGGDLAAGCHERPRMKWKRHSVTVGMMFKAKVENNRRRLRSAGPVTKTSRTSTPFQALDATHPDDMNGIYLGHQHKVQMICDLAAAGIIKLPPSQSELSVPNLPYANEASSVKGSKVRHDQRINDRRRRTSEPHIPTLEPKRAMNRYSSPAAMGPSPHKIRRRATLVAHIENPSGESIEKLDIRSGNWHDQKSANVYALYPPAVSHHPSWSRLNGLDMTPSRQAGRSSISLVSDDAGADEAAKNPVNPRLPLPPFAVIPNTFAQPRPQSQRNSLGAPLMEKWEQEAAGPVDVFGPIQISPLLRRHSSSPSPISSTTRTRRSTRSGRTANDGHSCPRGRASFGDQVYLSEDKARTAFSHFQLSNESATSSFNARRPEQDVTEPPSTTSVNGGCFSPGGTNGHSTDSPTSRTQPQPPIITSPLSQTPQAVVELAAPPPETNAANQKAKAPLKSRIKAFMRRVSAIMHLGPQPTRKLQTRARPGWAE
ncbi:hypothetical protein FRB99_001418 [Tulasnella sp. 403]|nr:hypothetical protein FRB99_001418 [Tulasnella sp. 403]